MICHLFLGHNTIAYEAIGVYAGRCGTIVSYGILLALAGDI